MNRPVQVLLSIRTGAVLALMVQHLGDLAKTGQVHLATNPDDDSEEVTALITRLRQRGVEVNRVPPDDQLEAWGLEHLREPVAAPDDDLEVSAIDADTEALIAGSTFDGVEAIIDATSAQLSASAMSAASFTASVSDPAAIHEGSSEDGAAIAPGSNEDSPSEPGTDANGSPSE